MAKTKTRRRSLFERFLRKGATFAFDPSGNLAQPFNILMKGRVVGHVSGYGQNNPAIDELSATVLLLEELDLETAERLREDLARELSLALNVRLEQEQLHLSVFLSRPYMSNFATPHLQMWAK